VSGRVRRVGYAPRMGRVRTAPRRIIITDEHEAEAKAELLRKHHSRIGLFFLRLVGWPVARPVDRARYSTPPHQHAVHHDAAHRDSQAK
jgi:hypothetical protein